MNGVSRFLVAALALSAAPLPAAPASARCMPATRRIGVVFARSPRILFWGGTCRGYVLPGKKMACPGDIVFWSVINGCDDRTLDDVFISGLDGVMEEKCSAFTQDLGIADAQVIKCRVKAGAALGKHKYDVAQVEMYRVGDESRPRTKILIDPELEIRR